MNVRSRLPRSCSISFKRLPRRYLEQCRTNPLVFRRVPGAFGDGMFAAVRESGPVVPRIVGRDGELAVVRDVLDGVGDGPATLALWGDTGIGKSTIWEAAVSQAR